ncbi:Uncharacterized membrane protein YsdA, DUF1294 family [Lachnospiraceae bacterium C7]|nr:Uncharacterized membrane protein YsdA, DUF1294 family [Lachnospiraceae bacterium C7]
MTLKIFLTYYVAVNTITFITFCTDKKRAIKKQWRIPEKTLLGLSLIGGAAGGLIGMYGCHHKTRKWYFSLGIPAMLALHCIVLRYLKLL